MEGNREPDVEPAPPVVDTVTAPDGQPVQATSPVPDPPEVPDLERRERPDPVDNAPQ